jgi:adenylate kinase
MAKAAKLCLPARMIFLGPPGAPSDDISNLGSGKGTLSARLIKRFDGQIASLASSDILRRHIAQQTPLGVRASAIMDEGRLLDDATMSELVTSELSGRGWVPSVARHSLSDPFFAGKRSFSSTSAAAATTDSGLHSPLQQSWLLDGFPRTLSQALSLDAFLQPRHCPLNMVINICVPPAAILARITSRLIHPSSGRVYNLSYNPPRNPGVDDVTGEPLIRRTDDEEIVWRARVEHYEEEVGPLEKWAEIKGLVWKVTGETSDEIYPKIEAEVLRRFGRDDGIGIGLGERVLKDVDVAK